MRLANVAKSARPAKDQPQEKKQPQGILDQRASATLQKNRVGMLSVSPLTLQLSALQQMADRHGGLAERRSAQGDSVIQAKMFFVPNTHHLVDPEDLEVWRIEQYQAALKTAVGSLGENDNQGMAIAKVNLSFSDQGLNNGYRLVWEGNRAFLHNALNPHDALNPGGERVEYLGSVLDEQDDALYLAHDNGNGRVHVNRGDRSQKVQGANNQYSPRFVNRSITDFEVDRLRGRNDLGPKDNTRRTLLEHVTGRNDGSFTSYSTSPNDVMNAQGELFNASGHGRVSIDLAHIASGNIYDLSTRAGVRNNLVPSMGQSSRPKIDAIMDAAQQRAALENRIGPGVKLPDVPGATRDKQTAGKVNPESHILPDSHFQAVTDAFRTKEVLIDGQVPFESVVSYGANSGGHHIGAVAPGAIATNKANSDQLTLDADQALTNAEQMPAVVLQPLYQAEITLLQARLGADGLAHYNSARLTGNVDGKAAKNLQFHTALREAAAGLRDEALALARIYQRRSEAGWAGATAQDLQNRLQSIGNRAAAEFSNYAPLP